MDNAKFLEPIDSEKEDAQESLPVYEVLTYPADYTLDGLVEKFTKKQIQIPSLQRGYVWTQRQASKLIESFLLGLPVPPIFLYQRREDNSLQVIDGHQRLKTIIYFFQGLFGDTKRASEFRLTGLNSKSPYLNQTYQSLQEGDVSAFNRLTNSVLRAFIMKQVRPNDDGSIFQVFERLNSGGVALNGQEIRNCLYDGKFNKLLQALNGIQEWRDILGRKHPDSRMRDAELILRILALLNSEENYKHPMKEFLNTFIKSHQELPNGDSQSFSVQFQATAKAISKSLGKKPFHVRRGLNAAVCDSVFVAFAKNLSRAGSIAPSEMKQRFHKLIADNEYILWTTKATTNDEVVPDRISKAENILFGRHPRQ